MSKWHQPYNHPAAFRTTSTFIRSVAVAMLLVLGLSQVFQAVHTCAHADEHMEVSSATMFVAAEHDHDSTAKTAEHTCPVCHGHVWALVAFLAILAFLGLPRGPRTPGLHDLWREQWCQTLLKARAPPVTV